MKNIVIVFLLFVAVVAFCGENVLNSKLAGTWYTTYPTALKKELNGYLNNVKEKQLDNLIALILPHAGYIYSGQTMACGIKEIQGKKYNRIIIIGPSHYAYMINKINVPSVDYYKTPLGLIELDKPFINKIKNFPQTLSNLNIHKAEHSIQIELPFLQVVLGSKFKLVPILVGQLDKKTANRIGRELRSIIDDKTLVIVSSDFTHYGHTFRNIPFPLDENTPKRIRQLDMEAVQNIEKISFDGFETYIEKTKNTICGKDAIAVLLAMLPPDTETTLLNYTTSGERMGSYATSVSYVAMGFTGKWRDNNKGKMKMTTDSMPKVELLNKEAKESLLKLARETVIYYDEFNKMPVPEDLGIKITPEMKQVMGAFVTLHEGGMLRGCIGEIVPRRPLYEAVMDQAVNSAFRDYRFAPVKSSEIPHLEFEISALTPSKPVASYKDIVLGRDGMTLTKHGRSAVFLPQVAPEQGWTLDETLTNLSAKAGLPLNAWKKDAHFTVFQAIVFSEKSIE